MQTFNGRGTRWPTSHRAAWLSIFTNSELALGLTVAIGLLLIFRIAVSKQQTIAWQGSEAALSELTFVLEKSSKEWGLTKDVIARAEANTRQAIRLLSEGHLMREPVAIRAVERNEALVIELRYKGQPLFA